MQKILNFVQEIGTIMYVGGILSHIVIGAVMGHPDAITAYHVYLYKELSAYILILPGLALKVGCDLLMYFALGIRGNWLKLKILMMAFLATNAFVFLVPMMPELVALARDALPTGEVSQAFIDKTRTEQLVGMSNVVPLVLELVLGSFRPRLFSERSSRTM